MSLDPKTSKLGKEIADSIALHPEFVTNLAKVAEISVMKGYKPFNWLEQDSTVTVSSLLNAHARHLKASKLGRKENIEKNEQGEEIDIKVDHLVFAAYNLLMAALIIKELPKNDDRMFVDKVNKDTLQVDSILRANLGDLIDGICKG